MEAHGDWWPSCRVNMPQHAHHHKCSAKFPRQQTSVTQSRFYSTRLAVEWSHWMTFVPSPDACLPVCPAWEAVHSQCDAGAAHVACRWSLLTWLQHVNWRKKKEDRYRTYLRFLVTC